MKEFAPSRGKFFPLREAMNEQENKFFLEGITLSGNKSNSILIQMVFQSTIMSRFDRYETRVKLPRKHTT